VIGAAKRKAQEDSDERSIPQTRFDGRQGDTVADGSVRGRFCCRNRHTDGAGRLVDFLKPSIVTRWIVRATYARLY
jgi:hypothetical protein